jgi:pilus assembly protein CpaE
MTSNEFVKAENEKKRGEMIVFISGKGGVGKTVISVNAAVALNNKGFSTCILDGSFQFGDVNLAFDIQPRVTVSDLIKENESFENTNLSSYLHSHESGVKILAAPSKPEYADLVTAALIPKICEKILDEHEFLIVDLPSGLSENNLTFLEMSQSIFLVTDLEMAALKNTKTMLRTLKMLGMESKIKVIVNRSDMEGLIKVNDVQDMLEADEILTISNNFKIVSKSFNIGIPFVISKQSEKISSEIIAIVNEFGTNRPKPRRRQKKRHGFMGFLKL